jgi:hypothetical protein
MGGILKVAGVPGFLANLDEMYEAADAEGAVWRTFVGLWWDRYGTGEVSTKDLHEVALACEPPLPLGTGSEHSQRIRLGKALGRMRDRVFVLGEIKVRITAAGIRHQAQRWKLDLENEGLDEHSQHSPMEAAGGECWPVEEQHSHPYSHRKTEPNQSVGECGECFSTLDTRADTRAHVRAIGNGGKHSPHSQHSHSPENSGAYPGECGGESGNGHPPPRNGQHASSSPVERLSFDAVFEAHGLDPWNEEDRRTAVEIWMGQPTGPPIDGRT